MGTLNMRNESPTLRATTAVFSRLVGKLIVYIVQTLCKSTVWKAPTNYSLFVVKATVFRLIAQLQNKFPTYKIYVVSYFFLKKNESFPFLFEYYSLQFKLLTVQTVKLNDFQECKNGVYFR